MKIRHLLLSFLLIAAIIGCEKNTLSKIPQITLIGFEPAGDTMRANRDTAYITFTFKDGDADIANDTATSAIYVKDSRFDTAGFLKYTFPQIDASVEDAKKGLSGECTFNFSDIGQPVPRADSLHTATGDTLHYELYITDRAKHQSNHIVTHTFIVLP